VATEREKKLLTQNESPKHNESPSMKIICAQKENILTEENYDFSKNKKSGIRRIIS